MNKIYKVIWSKVKHQYVVVSELAHSNGKQSRTAKRSLRSRIAALVVCGAIAAFGVFGVTEQQAFAGIGQAVEAQYVAIAVDDSNDNGRNNRRFSFDRESYNYHKETLPGTNTTYWVRDGYSIKLEYGYRFPQSQGAADNKQIVAYKTDANADTGGLLQSNQVMIDTSSTSSGEPVTTYTGSILNDVEVGTYVGAVNTSSTETPATFNYYIEDDNGKYIDAGGNPDMGEENHFDERFVEATLNADGSYTVNIDGKNQVVSRDNLYVINDKYKDISGREHDNYKIGVFTTTSNQIYTGRVFGKHNEVLMTAQDKDGNYYSYWAANTDDPNAPLTGMTIGQFNTSLKEIDTNSRKLAGDDIKQIDVTSTGENKGTIGLLRRGTYNEATGEWEGNTYAPGTINITSEAKTGEDTKIRFANEANPDGFTVDAGSRVVGKTGADGTTEANPNDTLTGIEINGQNYKLSGGKIYTDGDGIAIDDENDNKISVRLKDDETNLTVDDTGLALNKDLTVDSVNAKGTTIDKKGLTAGNVKVNAENATVTGLSNTTWDTEIASAVEANENGEAGYAATQGQLKDVADTAGTAEAEAKKHTTVKLADGEENLTLDEGTNAEGGKEYTVALDKELNVTSVNAEGTTISSTGLTAGKVNVDATTNTVSGLSNTTWDPLNKNYKGSNLAATESQLEVVNTKVDAGWALYSDGNKIKDVKPGDNWISVDAGENVSISKNENGNGLTISADLKDLDVEDTNAVLYDDDDKTTVTLAGTNGTRITNVAKGDISEKSTEAVNGSQLYATNQKVDAGWTATDGKTGITVSPTNNTLKFAGDDNITVTADDKNNAISVGLNDNITLGKGDNQININATGTDEENSSGKIVIGQGNKTVEINNSSITLNKSLVIDGSGVNGAIIHGLSNNNWDPKEKDNSTTAATEGQLYDVYDGSVKYWQNQDGTYDKSFIQLEGGEEGTTITHLKDGVVAEHSTEAINGSQLWETQQQIKDVETTANKHTIVSTTKDSNLTVKNVAGEGEADNYQVALKDDITLKGDSSSIELTGTKGTIQVNQETAEGTNFTNINGNVVSIGYTNSEGIENAIVIDGGKGTITGLSNTTWDDELAKQVADSEELQGTAATQGQLQQAVSEVSGIVNKGWTAKAGDNDGEINITPGDTLNFEGDGNITVSATGGTSNELKFGLNDNITLGDKESTSITLYTDPTSETTVVGTDGNTTNVTGYVPESYKSGTGADFVKNNGGFALFTTDTQGHGIFGVTTKGTAHGKDFVTYTKDIYGNDTRYSLNDVGDAVAQMSSYYNGKNSYTVFSRYLNEAEKDNPFVTVDEDGNKINATRDIPLALRDDGAVLIGATIKGEDFTDNGIRINAETKTTYDENGNEVTNNIATITGLENTEWKPPTPVATFAANDGSATVTSRAATESQLNDLYSAVAAYDVNVDGTIDYSHIALAGTPYGASRSGNGTHTGGTSITNVAYASGKDGSEAVNVDYLNDAINNAVKDGGAISDSDRHLQEGTYHVNDQGKVELIVADEKGENQSTVTIDNIANKNDITNLDNKIDNTFNDLNDKINNIDNVETDVKGGNINEDGTISLKTENEDGTTTNVTLKGQLTDSGVVQEGTTFDKETGTLTITSQDKYSGETSSVTVEGIASTEVVGATTKEDLATAYKDADKDGNATTEYITDSESMVEADVALDHAIQDVAGTSYANDMVLSNRIDSVEKRLGNVEERIDKVGAMAAAIANLRTMGFDPEAPTEIAIGVGQYKSETGIAIGVFHYPNQDFMLSASLSSSGDELMGGIGATWKLGRKSAAERAKDEEARHLEQAEEMKKLAQQEKVKAQAQRHAKLLAERQQASQKNA